MLEEIQNCSNVESVYTSMSTPQNNLHIPSTPFEKVSPTDIIPVFQQT